MLICGRSKWRPPGFLCCDGKSEMAKKLSTADILKAARAQAGQGGEAPPAAQPASGETPPLRPRLPSHKQPRKSQRPQHRHRQRRPPARAHRNRPKTFWPPLALNRAVPLRRQARLPHRRRHPQKRRQHLRPGRGFDKRHPRRGSRSSDRGRGPGSCQIDQRHLSGRPGTIGQGSGSGRGQARGRKTVKGGSETGSCSRSGCRRGRSSTLRPRNAQGGPRR